MVSHMGGQEVDAVQVGSTDQATDYTSYQALTFYGPYMVVDTNKGELGAGSAQVQCTLQLHVQFKGQR